MDTKLCITGLGVRGSPFINCYATADSAFGVYNGRLYPWGIGESATADYWTLRRQAVLFDVPESPIEIVGHDAERFLNKVFTRQVSKLRVGRAAYGLACVDDGGILMDGVLMRLEQDRFWYVQANGEFSPWLLAHRCGMEVIVRDPDSWVLQIQGPDSLEILERVCDQGAPENFRYFDVRECEMAGQRLLVSRTGWTGEVGFELYTLDPHIDGTILWKHLMQAGEEFGLIYSSLRSMQIRRVEAGILDYGTDMDRTMTPFQAGLGKFVDLSKTDFIGKLALAGADPRPLLYGIKCPASAPSYRAQVMWQGRTVGRIRSTAWSPLLECGVGYVCFAEPGDWLGRSVTVLTKGSELDGTVVSLPFYDADKRIPRGLDTMRP